MGVLNFTIERVLFKSTYRYSNNVEHASLLMHEELNLNRGLTCPHYLHLLFLDSENLRKEIVLWFNHRTVSYSKPQAGNPICSNK